MKKYEIEVTRVIYYEIEAKDLNTANDNADYLYNSGELFEYKELDSGSEITTITEIKGS